MSGGALLYPAAGTGPLALVLYDVFTTILHHWGGAGPLSGRLAFRFWQASLALTRRIGPERRRRILGRVGARRVPPPPGGVGAGPPRRRPRPGR